MRKGPKIKLTIQPPVDNEMQFADALNGASNLLRELADKVMHDGDHEQFRGTHHTVHADNDDADDIGDLIIGD
jgi:hypothetical protein